MAKNDLDYVEDLEFDFDDMGGDLEDSDSPTNDRKPSSKIIRTLSESAEQKARDSKYRRELLKASLPSEYTPALEDFDTVSKEAGSIWREQQKEWEKHRGEVKKMFRPYADVLGSIPGLKKISEWANEQDRVRDAGPSEEELDELRIQAILGETFGSIQQEQAAQMTQMESVRQEREDEKAAIDKADRDQLSKRTIEGNQLLVSINKNMGKVASYNDSINFPYQKRSLEMQARSLIVQQRMLQTLGSFRELAVKELQDIHKNTALPDYLKITPAEMAEQTVAGKILGAATAPFDGVGSKLANKVSTKVKSKMKDFWTEFGSAISMANEQNESMTDDGMGGNRSAFTGLKDIVGGAFGDALIDKPAKLIQNKVAPKIRDMIERHTGAKLYGSRLNTMGGGFAELFNDALKTGQTGNGLLDGIIKIFDLQDAAITGNRQVYDTKQLDLEKTVAMDNRFKLSVTEVIPAWLKKIHAEIYSGNNRDAEAEDLTWDFKSSKFIKTSELHDRMMDEFVDKDKVKARVKAIHEWVTLITQNAVSKAAYDFVTGWVTKQINSSSAITPLKLLSDETPMPKDIREELAFILPVTLKLSEKQKEMIQSGLMIDIIAAHAHGSEGYGSMMNKIADQGHVVKSTNPIDIDKLNKLAATPEGRAFLQERDIVIDNGNGAFSINDGWERDLESQYEVTRESKATGRKIGYRKNKRIENDDGTDTLSEELYDYDRFYEDEDVTKRKGEKMFGMGSFYSSTEQKERKRILAMVAQFRDPENRNNPGWGEQYFIDKQGNTHTVAEKDFFEKRKKLRPDIDRYFKRGYASGGQIESFAKGGDTRLKEGVTPGDADTERTVKTHGGEFVVSHDATKFNVQVLEAINKYGAPLVNADGSINSVYHKLFGFKTAKDFNAKGKIKGVATKANEVRNEQSEIMIKNFLAKMDLGLLKPDVVKTFSDPKKSTERRLALVMKHWSIQQKDQMKKDPKQFGKNLASRGIDMMNGKIDQWIDTDKTGVNIEIKNKMIAGAKSVGSKAKGNVLASKDAAIKKLNDGKRVAKSALVDRDRTLESVRSAVDGDIANKPFERAQDIYMEGVKSPILRRFAFGQRGYFDQKTGQVIKKPTDVTGTIVNVKGEVILSNEDLLFNKFYTMDKGHVIPFKFLGMDDANRKFTTTAEYAKERLNIIKASQQYQDAMQKVNDVKDRFLIDKPIDIYVLSNLSTPRLLATFFKEGRYIDQNTGNVLWTHHDITGPVMLDGEMVLTQADLEAGLFDSKKEHVKISKLKQYRNMAFKRSHEMYNKYAAKHVNKFTGKAMDWASKMGEKQIGLNFDKNPIDVYVAGEKEPRLRAVDFQAGKYFCKDKPIRSHSGITGAVMAQNEHGFYEVLSVADMDKLVDGMGEKIKLTGMMSSKERFVNYLKEAALPSAKLKKLRTFISMTPEKRQELMNDKLKNAKIAYDVYTKGNPVKPIMTKAGFEANEYISVKTGKPIIIPEQIDGAVVDSQGNQILSDEDFAKGILTIDGKKIHSMGGGILSSLQGSLAIGNRMKGLLRGMVNPPKIDLDAIQEADQAPEVVKNNTYTVKFKMKKGQGLPPDLARINNTTFTDEDIKNGRLIELDFEGKSKTVDNVKNIDDSTWLTYPGRKISDGVSFLKVFSNNGGIFDEDGKFIKTAKHTGKKVSSGPSKVKDALTTKLKGIFGDGFNAIKDKLGLSSFRLGSWQQQRADKNKDKKDDGKKEEGKEKKGSWMSRLVKMLMLPLGGLFGMVGAGLAAIKTSFVGAIGWLAKAMITKSMSGLGGLLGGAAAGGGRLGMLGKAAVAGLATYGGIKAYNYLDGDAGAQDGFNDEDRNGANTGTDSTSKVLNMAEGGPEETSNGGFLDTVTNNPLASAALTAAMFMPGTVLKGAGMVGKGIYRGGKAVVGGAGRLLGRGVGATAGGVAARAPGLLGRAVGAAGSVASGAGRLLGGTAAATGLGMRVAGGAAMTALRIVSGPIGWGLTAAWFGGNALMKLWNNHKNPWNRFRLAQYGFNHNNKEVMEKIAKIEAAAIPLVKITAKGVCTLKGDEKAMSEILKICGFKDEQGQDIAEQQERLPKFASWFKHRFIRVYASYLRILLRLRGKAEMIDLQTLNRQEQELLLKEVHFSSMTDTPYVVTFSPFEDPAETNMGTTDVDKIYRKLANKITQIAPTKGFTIPKDFGEEGGPTGSVSKNADGLDDKTAKKPAKDASDEEKVKYELDKQIEEGNKDPKSAVDKANEAVKYQADQAKLITKMNNEAIIKSAEKVNSETTELFEKQTVTLTSRLSGVWSQFSSKMSGAWDQLKSGDVAGATATTVGAAYNAVGNSIDAGIDYATDGFSKLTGKTGETQKMIYQAFLKAGLSPNQAKAITAEVGRENDYKPSIVFGSHVDPAKDKNGNNIINTGMISWNGARGEKLRELLRSRGLLNGNKMPQTQEALDAQAEFAVSEMKGAYAKKLPHFLSNPNADPDSFAKELGSKYVVWAYGQDTIRAGGGKRKAFDWKAHDNKRKKYLQALGDVRSTPTTGTTTGNTPNNTPVGSAVVVVQPTTTTQQQAAKTSATDKVTTIATNANKAQVTPGTPTAATQSQTTTNASSNGSADWNFSKIAEHAMKNAKPSTIGMCGQYTRQALQAGDLKKKISKICGGTLGASAYMFVNKLPKIGYNPVFSGKKLGNFVPQIGDVVIFGKGIYGNPKKSGGGYYHGHAAVYTGKKWVSDFVQATVYPSSSHSANGLQMTIFRADGIAPQGGYDGTPSISQEADGKPDTTTDDSGNAISSTINNVNTGTASPTGVAIGGGIAANGYGGSNNGGVGISDSNAIFGQQLDVQREILSVLKQMAGGNYTPNQNNQQQNAQQRDGVQSTINGVPVDAQGRPIQQGMTTPNLGVVSQAKPEQSPFDGIKNPVSVLKPV